MEVPADHPQAQVGGLGQLLAVFVELSAWPAWVNLRVAAVVVGQLL
ncbi:hypothetical protein [Mycobacterium sp. 852002-51057_SCH5723018]|nr:hypothetical protein [Mycobacterium sp. 852002-51057_SCH5723018]